MEDNRKLFNISELRFWAKNPRFTNFKKVKILEIGREDFLLYDNKDIYLENLDNYYKNLIKNKKMIYKLLELVENISYSGFEADTDEILITSSPFLIKNTNNSIYSKIYYVLEGNRRLFALHLLLNLNDSRKILEKNIEKNEYNKFLEIFRLNNYNIQEVECKIFNVKEKGEKYTWKILNSRHFGKRKGKLNWPRGSILNIIFTTIIKFRKEHEILDNQELTSEQFNQMIKEVESYTGKNVNTFDLIGSLWSITVIEEYNQHVVENQKIILEQTDDQLETYEKDNENEYDSNDINDSPFSISSLELAHNTIKLPNEVGESKNLKEIIKLEINTRKWKVFHSLNLVQWQNLCIYLINSIKNKNLNTRKFKPEYIEELITLLSLNQRLSNQVIESSKKGKIRYDQLTILSIKNISEEEIIFDNEEERKTYKSMKESIIPDMDEITKLSIFLESKLNIVTNKFIYSLLYTWCKEFKPIIFSKTYLQPLYYPYFIISSLLRSTSELLCNFWVMIDDKLQIEFTEEFKKGNKGFKNNNSHINNAINSNQINDDIEKIYCKDCEGKNILWFTSNNIKSIKNKLVSFYSTFLRNTSNDIAKFLVKKKMN